jgi:hypothetical protein
MRDTFIITSIIICFLNVAGCRKEVTSTTNAPQLAIMTPVENSSFNKNDTVRISANAINSENLHGYEITIHPANDTTATFRSVNHVHATSLSIQEKWANTSPAVKNQVVEIKVFTDHNGGFITQKRNIICN